MLKNKIDKNMDFDSASTIGMNTRGSMYKNFENSLFELRFYLDLQNMPSKWA